MARDGAHHFGQQYQNADGFILAPKGHPQAQETGACLELL
jgi:hypothetical protein